MKKGLLVVLSALAIISCTKESTSIRPEINSLTMDGADHDIVVAAGTTTTVSAVISDDRELGQVKFTAHNVFDGHDHGKVMTFIPFEAIHIDDLSGKNAEVNWLMDIDENATAGPYHVLAQAFDNDGNEAEFREISFMITNNGMAQIDLTSHDFAAGTIDVETGENISLAGVITDDQDISEITISVKKHGHDDHDHHHGKTDDDIIYEMDWDLIGSNDMSWDLSVDGNVNFTFPTQVDGHEDYELTIRVKDSDGNISILEGTFHLH